MGPCCRSGGAGCAARSGADGGHIGTLTCNVSGGVGYIITSAKSMACTFSSPSFRAAALFRRHSQIRHRYRRHRRGGDVLGGVRPGQHRARRPAGSYVGASAEASAGLGLGANALVGGFNGSIALQPLSIQGQTGLNVAAGVASLELRAETLRRAISLPRLAIAASIARA